MAWAGKGCGKGGVHVNYNVPDLPHSSIDKLPRDGVAVYHGAADKATDFCERLQKAMEGFEFGECTFDNIDVSTVHWPQSEFQMLLDVLIEKGATTKRLKAFKCGLGDEAIRILAGWLEMMPPTDLPKEIHLSNNRISMESLDNLISIIETKRLELTTQVPAVWLRVENNEGVSSKELEELVQNGRCAWVPRCNGEEHKRCFDAVAMPSFKNNPRRDAAKDKEVNLTPALYTGGGGSGGSHWDKSKGGSTWSQDDIQSRRDDHSGRDGDRGGRSWDKEKTTAPWHQERGKSWDAEDKNRASWDNRGWSGSKDDGKKDDWWSKNGKDHQDKSSWDRGGGRDWKERDAGSGRRREEPHHSRDARDAREARPARARSSSRGAGRPSGREADKSRRSRSPSRRSIVLKEAPRKEATRREAPLARKEAAPAARKAPTTMPNGWTQHWSDEFKLPYYWNSATNESRWEVPDGC